MSNSSIHEVITFNLILFSIAVVYVGYLSDKLGREKLILIGSALLTLTAYPFFYLIVKGSVFSMISALIAFGISASLIAGCYGALLPELFPTQIRYTGVSMAYNLAFSVGGGTMPFLVTLLVKMTHHPIAVACYMMTLSVLCFISTLTLRMAPAKITV